MSDLLLLTFVHVVLFAYWLGADLGVFYASYIVTDAGASVPARGTAAKILQALDQAPRVCMTLMLPVGVHLAWRMQLLAVSGIAVAAAWAVALAWLSTVLLLHYRADKPYAAPLARADFVFRVALVVVLLAIAGFSLAGAGIVRAPYVSYKLLLFAGIVTCGLLIRVKLKPFGPAFAALMNDGPSDAVNRTIRESLAACRPIVITIWIALLTSAALGLHVI